MALLILSSWSVLAQTPKLTEQQVSGRVTLKGSGLAGVTVVVWKQPFTNPEFSRPLTAKTDWEGKYRMRVPSGSYYAALNAPGYIEIEEGHAARTMRPLIVTGDNAINDFNFEVSAGGVITGKVTNSEGQPLIEIPVSLISLETERPVMFARPEPTTRIQTDDRGIYRIFGVVPGRYVLAAGEAVTVYGGMRGRLMYRRTFYPGSLSKEKARAISIDAGQELIGFDLKLGLPEKAYSITGHVIQEETGQSLAGIGCALDVIENGRPSGGIRGSTHTNDRGICTIENVPAGTYRISLWSAPTNYGTSNQNFYGESPEFSVVDRDVDEVVILASQGTSISGTVVLEGYQDNRITAEFRKINFLAYTIQEGKYVIPKTIVQREDGTFTIGSLLPGKLFLSMSNSSGTNLPFTLLRIELQGIEQKDPIVVRAGEPISNLRLVCASAQGSVRGRIKLSSGALPTDLKGTALLYNNDRPFLSGTVDARGQFLISNVPTGIYKLVISISSEGNQKLHARSEQLVEVTNGQSTDLSVLMEPQTSP